MKRSNSEFEDELEETQGFEDSIEENFNQPGIIKSLSIENFMCHDNLSMEFGPGVNFVIGVNGSGKSAILTSITICLGTKASATSRGNSVKSLIKDGKSFAKVTLKLCNKGPDGYKPELYGDTIIIERLIVKEGSGGGYRILSSTYKVINTRKSEIEALCDHLGIQPDNPLAILSQEAAKSFIGATTPEDKYQKFLQGTYLTQLNDDLQTINETVNYTQKIILSKKSIVEKYAQEYEEAKQRYKSMEKAKRLQSEIVHLKNQMAWAQVSELEREEDKLKETLKNSDQETHQIKQEIDVLVDKSNILTQELTRKNEQRELILQDKNVKKARLEDLIKTFNGYSEHKKECLREIKEFKENIRDLEQEKAQHEKNLKVEKERAQQSSLGRKEAINQKIQVHSTKIKELEKQENTLKEQREQASDGFNKCAQDIQVESSKQGEVCAEIKKIKIFINRLKDQKENSLNSYGNNIPAVMNDIIKFSGWKEIPIGPLGLHIKLKDPKWSLTIESVLGKTLNSFLVSNYQDQQNLRKIFEKHRCNSPIFVSKPVIIDFSQGEPSTEFKTILRLLEINNKQVLNQLVNVHRIEKSILIEDQVKADKIMQSPPFNVTSCYTPDGFQIGQKGGGFSTISLQIYNGPPRLTKDISGAMISANQKLRDSQLRLSGIEETLKQLEHTKGSLGKAFNTLKVSLSKCASEMRFEKDSIKDLENDLKVTKAVDFEQLETEIKECDEKIKAQILQIQKMKENVSESEVLFKAAEAELQAAGAELKSGNPEETRIKNEIIQLVEDVNNNNSKIDEYEKKYKEILTTKQKCEAELGEFKTRIEFFTIEAQKYFPDKVKVDISPKDLDNKIIRAEKQLKIAQDHLGQTIEEIQTELNEKGNIYKKARTETNQMEQFIKIIEEAYIMRKNRWETFLIKISDRVRLNFRYNLALRNFQGHLDLDHVKKRLVPNVHPNEKSLTTSSNDKGRDPKSLSGGEKSFSTICLLLAIWQAMDCPVRCLDEYDVFMDAANQNLSTKLILEYAKQKSSAQHILITPNSLSQIQLSSNIKVNQLSDPKRGS